MSRWPRSAIFDCDSLFDDFGRGECVLDRGELLAQRADLLIEDVDLGERLGGDLFLGVERACGGRGPPGGVGGGSRVRRLVLEPLLRALR